MTLDAFDDDGDGSAAVAAAAAAAGTEHLRIIRIRIN